VRKHADFDDVVAVTQTIMKHRDNHGTIFVTVKDEKMNLKQIVIPLFYFGQAPLQGG
jgi:hypothetical protein